MGAGMWVSNPFFIFPSALGIVFNGQTNPFIFPASWPVEAMQAAVRRDIRGYKKPFSSLLSVLSLRNPFSQGDWWCARRPCHLEVLGLTGILCSFRLTFPSHSSLFCRFLKELVDAPLGMGSKAAPQDRRRLKRCFQPHDTGASEPGRGKTGASCLSSMLLCSALASAPCPVSQ